MCWVFFFSFLFYLLSLTCSPGEVQTWAAICNNPRPGWERKRAWGSLPRVGGREEWYLGRSLQWARCHVQHSHLHLPQEFLSQLWEERCPFHRSGNWAGIKREQKVGGRWWSPQTPEWAKCRCPGWASSCCHDNHFQGAYSTALC